MYYKQQGWTCVVIHAMYIGVWCNGNTRGFGPLILGSNPSAPTGKRFSNSFSYQEV